MNAATKISEATLALSSVRFRLFEGLVQSDFETLAPILMFRSFQVDDPLLRVGDESYEIFFVLDGTVKVEIPLVSSNARERIATLHAGHTVGEFSMVRAGKVTADVTAVTSVRCLSTNRDKLQVVLHSHPKLGLQVYRNLSSILVDRLVDTNLLARNVLSQISLF
jgi:CRP-like cAMP-binding protein